MRDVRFRAWDKEVNKFFKPTYEAHKGNLEYLEIGLDGRLSRVVLDERDEIELEDESIFPGRYELMEYTGLKDKNGVEIYEGDIVEAMSEGLKGIFEIRWRQDGSPCWILYPAWQKGEVWHIASKKHSDGNYYDNFKVIGNIHEHPELLEVTK